MPKKVPTVISRTDTAVELEGVSKTFVQWQRDNTGRGLLRNLLKPEKRAVTALDDVSFSIKTGEFVAYAGPNGAGKSTTIKLLCGMLLPEAGRVSVLSLSPEKSRVPLMRRLGVVFGNRTELWWDHPVIQSFEWKKVVWDIPEAVYERNLKLLTELLELEGLLRTFARELSLGQRMRADLALALLHSPALLLLDEPTLGLDVVAKRQMIAFLKRVNREEGVTILVTSHDMDDLEEMARRILMLARGRIAYDGGFDGLRDITGQLSRVGVAMTNGGTPALPEGQLLSAQNGVYEFAVDFSRLPVRDLLYRLSQMEGVKDVEVRRAPIEEVIAELYRRWK